MCENSGVKAQRSRVGYDSWGGAASPAPAPPANVSSGGVTKSCSGPN